MSTKQPETKLTEPKEEKKPLSPLDVAEQLRNKLPDGEKQYQAMKKFSEGKLSYAEMRGLCG